MKSIKKYIFPPTLCLLLLPIISFLVQARPEIIRASISYYSDEYVETGIIRDLGNEKNLEEVFQFYSYFETVYDSKERVINFKEYKQGNVILEEQYAYENDDTDPVRKTVLLPGQEPEVIQLPR